VSEAAEQAALEPGDLVRRERKAAGPSVINRRPSARSAVTIETGP
jgi:hypothetical protein